MMSTATEPGWSLRLLDHLQLRSPMGEVRLTSRKAVALIVYLALQRGMTARRDIVANLLWQDVDTAQARGNLRQAIAAIRKVETADSPVLLADVDTLRLVPSLETDCAVFERLSAGGTADRVAAADVYRTDLAAGFTLRDAPAFNEWLVLAQAEWRQKIVELLLGVAVASSLENDDLSIGVTATLRLLAVDPLNEAAHRALMRLYCRQGRSALALARFRSLSDLLRNELHITPEAATRQLYDAIRSDRLSRDAVETRSPRPAAPEPGSEPAEPAAPRRIAVVDDEENLRDAVATYLRLHGFDAVECAGGADLDLALGAGAIDLILLDVTMPGEDGFAIARRLQGQFPMIMLTARSDLVDRVVGLEIGADDYVAKPYELREILARVRAVLRRAEGAASAVATSRGQA